MTNTPATDSPHFRKHLPTGIALRRHAGRVGGVTMNSRRTTWERKVEEKSKALGSGSTLHQDALAVWARWDHILFCKVALMINAFLTSRYYYETQITELEWKLCNMWGYRPSEGAVIISIIIIIFIAGCCKVKPTWVWMCQSPTRYTEATLSIRNGDINMGNGLHRS